MHASRRVSQQLPQLSACGPLLDVPVDRDGHLLRHLGAGARGDGLASATSPGLMRNCRLTHKFAKTGRYASEEENGEDMCQIQAPISFREFKKIVWERAIRNSAS